MKFFSNKIMLLLTMFSVFQCYGSTLDRKSKDPLYFDTEKANQVKQYIQDSRDLKKDLGEPLGDTATLDAHVQSNLEYLKKISDLKLEFNDILERMPKEGESKEVSSLKSSLEDAIQSISLQQRKAKIFPSSLEREKLDKGNALSDLEALKNRAYESIRKSDEGVSPVVDQAIADDTKNDSDSEAVDEAMSDKAVRVDSSVQQNEASSNEASSKVPLGVMGLAHSSYFAQRPMLGARSGNMAKLAGMTPRGSAGIEKISGARPKIPVLNLKNLKKDDMTPEEVGDDLLSAPYEGPLKSLVKSLDPLYFNDRWVKKAENHIEGLRAQYPGSYPQTVERQKTFNSNVKYLRRLSGEKIGLKQELNKRIDDVRTNILSSIKKLDAKKQLDEKDKQLRNYFLNNLKLLGKGNYELFPALQELSKEINDIQAKQASAVSSLESLYESKLDTESSAADSDDDDKQPFASRVVPKLSLFRLHTSERETPIPLTSRLYNATQKASSSALETARGALKSARGVAQGWYDQGKNLVTPRAEDSSSGQFFPTGKDLDPRQLASWDDLRKKSLKIQALQKQGEEELQREALEKEETLRLKNLHTKVGTEEF